MIQLLIIASSQSHFKHLCHLYQIQPDQVRYIDTAERLRGIPPQSIVIFGDSWWQNKSPHEVDEIEFLVKRHNELRKGKKNG